METVPQPVILPCGKRQLMLETVLFLLIDRCDDPLILSISFQKNVKLSILRLDDTKEERTKREHSRALFYVRSNAKVIKYFCLQHDT